MIYISSP